jgi:uncharacterized protein YciI
MPLFAAIFEDDLAAAERVRAVAEEAHVAWLEKHRDKVLVAGALRPAEGEPATGGLWLITAESAEEARRICTEDPFFVHGLRKSFRLESWSKGFPKEPVTL